MKHHIAQRGRVLQAYAWISFCFQLAVLDILVGGYLGEDIIWPDMSTTHFGKHTASVVGHWVLINGV